MRLKKQTTILMKGGLLLTLLLMTGCSKAQVPNEPITQPVPPQNEVYTYEVEPETFSLSINTKEAAIPVSLPGERKQVSHFIEDQSGSRWEYPDQKVSVAISQESDYLSVSITSTDTKDNEFRWPSVSADTYYLPLGEGKRIPGNDPEWIQYLSGNRISMLEQLSMPFWATTHGEYAVLIIMENPYRSTMEFSEEGNVSFSVLNDYPEIDSDREKRFRIYLAPNDPAAIAKLYRQYVMGQGNFVTLEQKAEKNPDIRKLYGAPHIYLWGEWVLSPADIKWPALRKSLNSGIFKHMIDLAAKIPDSEEALDVFGQIADQDYVDNYQKNIVCRIISNLLQHKDFYKPELFPVQDDVIKELLKTDLSDLNPSELIQLNKHALAANLSETFQPAGQWMDHNTTGLIRELKQSGIDRAWIGLNDWTQAFVKPELAEEAVSNGYLIGPYDSYHSIHEPGKEQWITARFEDSSLYDNATVSDKSGEKIKGFQGVGRKLNPVLSLPSVKERVDSILQTKLPFNSWFIDCDATGEIYDDYSPDHRTTKQEDLSARLERMAYIRDQKNMVIGSEGGNDFAVSTIAFAHGIELPTFSWMDPDMSKDKDSPYYIGKYYSPTGGVAEHFSKKIPVKDFYYHIFLDPAYDLPLYKLVYNDSVITSYHWDWSTLKIPDAAKDRMLREILYNTPPLYHLDRSEWDEFSKVITSHTKVWSEFSKQAITKEMTGYKRITEDGYVQQTSFGDGLTVTANFGDESYSYENRDIPPQSLMIDQNGTGTIYTPEI